jgi:aryl-alcohol dehydrogenase-like predicted oxidoreductase
MKYRYCGNTGLLMSEIGLGTWRTLGNYVDQEEANTLVRCAWDLGINWFDTSNSYPNMKMPGVAEEVLGKAIADLPREQFILATKVWNSMYNRPYAGGLSRKEILTQVDKSLSRLGTDYLDIYFCHRFDGNIPLHETCQAMSDLVERGKILYWGVSQWRAHHVAEGAALCRQQGWRQPYVNQPAYHMFDRSAEEALLEQSARDGLGVTIYSPMATGYLAGKYRTGKNLPEPQSQDPEKRRKEEVKIAYRMPRVDQLYELADESGITLAQLSLAWCLRRPEITSCIVGASREEQLQDNVKASETVLGEDLLDRVEQILS